MGFFLDVEIKPEDTKQASTSRCAVGGVGAWLRMCVRGAGSAERRRRSFLKTWTKCRKRELLLLLLRGNKADGLSSGCGKSSK